MTVVTKDLEKVDPKVLENSAEPDLDALSNAEGDDFVEPKAEPGKEGADPVIPKTEIKTDGTDLTKQMAEQQGKVQQPAKPDEQGKPDEPAAAATKTDGEVQFTPMVQKLIDGIKLKFKDKIKVNEKVLEGMTEENAVEKLAEIFYENADFSESFDPEVLRFQKFIEANNGDVDKARKEFFGDNGSLLTMKDADLVAKYLVEDLGMKPEEATEEMKSMNVKVEALKLRKNIERNATIIQEQKLAAAEQQQTVKKQQLTTQREQEIKEVVGSFEKLNEVYGIPVDAKLKAEFPNTFRKWVTPDETGAAPILQLLQSNEHLAKLVFLVEHSQDAIKSTIFREKEAVKKNILDKLNPEPKVTDRNVLNTGKGDEVDLDRLSDAATD